MRLYEFLRLVAEPFLPVLYSKTRRDLAALLRRIPQRYPPVLDVGGRTSPYTIGLPAEISILDLPRTTHLQKTLNLGLSSDILLSLQGKRSNIVQVVIEDMLQCTLPAESFVGVVCVEVIEHVLENNAFLKQIKRVLTPGGWLYLTTPNGDYIRNEPPNFNPDHVRHYTRQELAGLLNEHFTQVKIEYGIKTGKYRFRGLRSMEISKPIKTLSSGLNNLINHIESRGLEDQPKRTAHLFATGWKL